MMVSCSPMVKDPGGIRTRSMEVVPAATFRSVEGLAHGYGMGWEGTRLRANDGFLFPHGEGSWWHQDQVDGGSASRHVQGRWGIVHGRRGGVGAREGKGLGQ